MSQLIVNSIVPAGGLPSGSNGGIIQVKQTIKKDVFTTSQAVTSGYTDLTGLSVAITPSSSSNKILVTTQIYNGAANNAVNFFRLLRGTTFIEQPSGTSSGTNYNAHAFSYYDANYQDSTAWSILDSPAELSFSELKNIKSFTDLATSNALKEIEFQRFKGLIKSKNDEIKYLKKFNI